MRTKPMSSLAAVGLVVALFVGVGVGDTVVSQAPNQVNGYFSDVTTPQFMADNFIVTTGGNFFYDITFWGAYFPGNTPVPDLFTMNVYNDNAGNVGGIVGNLLSNGAADTRAATGVQLFGVDEYVYTYRAELDLDPGTYWLEIYNDTTNSAPNDNWFWETGTSDPVGGALNTAFSQDFGATWSIFDDGQGLAFTITTKPVPEPSSFGALALLGLFAVRRRRK